MPALRKTQVPALRAPQLDFISVVGATGSPLWKEPFSSSTLSIPTSPSTLALDLAAVPLASYLLRHWSHVKHTGRFWLGKFWTSSPCSHSQSAKKRRARGSDRVTLEYWSLEMVIQAEQRNSPAWSSSSCGQKQNKTVSSPCRLELKGDKATPVVSFIYCKPKQENTEKFPCVWQRFERMLPVSLATVPNRE